MRNVPATAAFLVLAGVLLLLMSVVLSSDRIALIAFGVVCLVAAGIVETLNGRR